MKWVRLTLVAIVAAIATVAIDFISHAQKSSARTKLTPHQEYALFLLDSAIDELRLIEDIEARTELAESIVVLLAEKRCSRCGQLLNNLFDEALALKERPASDNDDRQVSREAIIRRIIQTAARFDRKLSESYIERYAKQITSDAGDLEKTSQANRQTANVYMRIAVDLVERDPTLAISLGQRALSVTVPYDTLTLLAKLRRKDTQLANRFFLSALASVKFRGGNDINELLLLYSYALSPLQVLQVTPQGLGTLSLVSYREVAVNYPIDPELARQYITLSTQIVLNPKRYEAQNFPRLIQGPRGDVFFLAIIEPQVANYLPALVSRLAEQRIFSAAFLSADQRHQTDNSLDRWLGARNETYASSATPSAEYYERLAEKTTDPKRKNQVYYRAASAAVREKKYDVALTIVDKMSDEYRDDARQFIKYHVALQATHENQPELAEEWARRDQDLARRAYIYTLLADSFLKHQDKDIGRAAGLLNEVEQIAAKLDQNQERAAVLIGAADVASQFDGARAFVLLRDAIKAGNKVDNFSGDNGLPRSLDIGGFYFDYSLYRNEFILTEALQKLGRINFDETAAAIREIKDPLARLRGIIALSGGVLVGARVA